MSGAVLDVRVRNWASLNSGGFLLMAELDGGGAWVLPEPSFEVALANYAGSIKAAVDLLIDRNPQLSVPARAAVMRISGRLMPLASAEYLERWRDAYEVG